MYVNEFKFLEQAIEIRVESLHVDIDTLMNQCLNKLKRFEKKESLVNEL
jgi:hypothetical protein